MDVTNGLVLVMIVINVGYLLNKLCENTTSNLLKWFFVIFTIEHFFISALFAFFLNDFSNINDPQDLYHLALNANSWNELFGMGHSFVGFVIYPFVKIGVSLEMLFLLFSLVSYLGFLGYFNLMGIQKKKKTPVLYLLFFLVPTIHVWTGCLGKESLLLLSMFYVLKQVKNREFNYLFYAMMILIFLIRPHVALVLVVSLVFVLFLDKELSSKFKIRMVVFSLFTFICLVSIFTFFFLKVEGLNMQSIDKYIGLFVSYATDNGGSSISIQDTTVFSRILYLIWMPFPLLYNISSPLQWLVAIENVYYLAVFLFVIFNYISKKNGVKTSSDYRFAMISGVLLIVLFASYLYNLGLGNRMKLMFLPYLFYGFMNILPGSLIIKEKL